MSYTDRIIDEILNRASDRSGVRLQSRTSRGSTRGNRRGGGAMFSPVVEEAPNLADLGAREQYRYRLVQTAAQLGTDESVLNKILEADTEELPLFEQALLSDDPQRNLVGAAFATGHQTSRVGNVIGGTLGTLFENLARPLNAVTGGLTEGLRTGGMNLLGGGSDVGFGDLLSAWGRGARRGWNNQENYFTGSVLSELNQYDVGGRSLDPLIADKGPIRAVQNFTGDVVLDPLTYLRINPVGRGNALDQGVQQLRAFVDEAVQTSELTQFRRLPKNQRGPIVESILNDIFSGAPKRGPGGRFTGPSLAERVAREGGGEIYDPVLNQGVRRSFELPKQMPKGYQARERLVEQILEADDLHRLRTGQQITRLEDFATTQLEAAKNGHVSIRFADREIFGNNPVSRKLYAGGARASRLIGYDSQGKARALNRAFNYKRADWGELPEHIRRAQGNHAVIGADYLTDLSKMRTLVDDFEWDEIIEGLDAFKLDGVDPATIWDNLDQKPLQKGQVGTVTSADDPLKNAELRTVGDVGRIIEAYMRNLDNLEQSLFLDPRKGGYFPLIKKDGTPLSAAEMKKPVSELRRRGVEFLDPMESFAQDVSMRLHKISIADALVETLDQYAIKVPELLSKARRVKNRETGEMVYRTSEAGQQIHEAALGDLNPITQELLRGTNPVVDPGALPFEKAKVGTKPYLETDEGARFLESLQQEAKRRGVARAGQLELVPASSVKSPVVQRWLQAVGAKNTDVLLPKPIADALTEMSRIAGNPSEARKLIRTYDHIMSGWKKAVTIYNPGYHIRNGFSDFFLNQSAGVRGPVPYEQATKVMAWRHSHADQIAGEVFEPLEALGTQFRQRMKQGSRRIKLGGQQIQTDEAWLLFSRFSGSQTGQIRAELSNIVDNAYRKGAGRGTRAGAFLTRQSENRETFMRLAHFLDRYGKEVQKRGIVIKKNGVITGEARKLAREVGDKVRYYNLDYGAKTAIERDILSRVIPFYTYLRRNLPLQLQLIAMQPGMIARYPKYKNLFEGLMGNPEEDESTVLLPGWIRDSFPWLLETERRRQSGPLAQILGLFGANSDEGATVMPMANMLPVGSLNEFASLTDPLLTEGRLPGMQDVSGQLAQTLSTVTPAARVPFEMALNRQTFTGQQIGDDWLGYLMGQVPMGRLGHTAVSEGVGGVQPAFMRWLTGLPVRQVTPQNEQSEFRRREDVLESVRERVRSQVNEELRSMGLQEVDSLPALDPEELISALLAAAEQNRRRVTYSPEYMMQNG